MMSDEKLELLTTIEELEIELAEAKETIKVFGVFHPDIYLMPRAIEFLKDELATANGLLDEVRVLLRPVFGRLCVDGSFRLFPSHKKKLSAILAKRREVE